MIQDARVPQFPRIVLVMHQDVWNLDLPRSNLLFFWISIRPIIEEVAFEGGICEKRDIHINTVRP